MPNRPRRPGFEDIMVPIRLQTVRVLTTPGTSALAGDPAATTIPMPRVDSPLQLSTRTMAWLTDHPQASKLVSSVWDTLTELEQAGHHPRLITALRRVLASHQPSPAGRCPTCRRTTWRRRPFPCTVWHQIRGELLGVFASGHHEPDTAAFRRDCVPTTAP